MRRSKTFENVGKRFENIRKRSKTSENVAAAPRSKNLRKFSSEGHAALILRRVRGAAVAAAAADAAAAAAAATPRPWPLRTIVIILGIYF